MLSMLIIALVMVCMSDISLAGEWTKKGEIPFEIIQCGACVFNNEAYIFGGPHGGQPRVLKYNPITDSWTKLPDMPNSRSGFSAIEIGGKIYMIGDMSRNNLPVDVYDPISGIWESKSAMPNFRGLSGVVPIGDDIYVLGGYTFAGNKNILDIHVYNTATDTWTEKKPMPLLLDSFFVYEYKGRILTFGGFFNEPNGNYFPISQVWEYDPVEETWTRKADMPNARAQASQILVPEVDGKLLIIGGIGNNWLGLSTFDVYDPVTDTWGNTQNMPVAVMAHSLVQINRLYYLFGGMRVSQQLDTINKNTYVYDPFVHNPFPQPTKSISPKESLIGTWASIKTDK